jgi:hypothetical protein
MAPQKRAVAVAPIGLQLLTGGHAGHWQVTHTLAKLRPCRAGLIGRHRRPLRRRFGRQLLIQAQDE